MDVIFFKDENGKEPAKEFLKGLSLSSNTRFHDYIKHLLEHGGLTSGVAFKKLHGYPLEEIRVKESNNLHRVIIHIKFKKIVLILHGFTKKEGRKTPEKELEIAHKRFLDFKKYFDG